jgi:acetyl-CoA carboxylase biotin carboxyl carrier protein
MTDQEMPQQSDDRTRQMQSNERSGGERRDHRARHRRQQHSSASSRPDPAINMDELRELVQLIGEHGFTDFELEREGFRVRLRRELAQQTLAANAVAPTPHTMHNFVAPQVQAETANSAVAAPPIAAQQSAPSAAHTLHPGAQAEAAASEDEDLRIINSPIVGTFYRAPSPASDPFVKLGSRVEPDTVVCIIEAMKLMNEIQAETSGEIIKIYVENGQPVEYGQPLFGIK